ncbi:phosphatase PAP2 family protein [Streptomyces sp. NBC_01456]|uniref:phosphatase PAP2 family protein n=1 Tax=unclassified Streptomyces TaxID=2593676 RepID=UPI002E360037|nr:MULTISPECIES: phosphatase PAP2 family protein [unclassified Streptomyces]
MDDRPETHYAVAALFLLDRCLALIAALFALFEGFTRVYVGDHYPHDVLASAVLALPVAYLVSMTLGHLATRPVPRLRTGTLRPVLAAEPGTAR